MFCLHFHLCTLSAFSHQRLSSHSLVSLSLCYMQYTILTRCTRTLNFHVSHCAGGYRSPLSFSHYRHTHPITHCVYHTAHSHSLSLPAYLPTAGGGICSWEDHTHTFGYLPTHRATLVEDLSRTFDLTVTWDYSSGGLGHASLFLLLISSFHLTHRTAG